MVSAGLTRCLRVPGRGLPRLPRRDPPQARPDQAQGPAGPGRPHHLRQPLRPEVARRDRRLGRLSGRNRARVDKRIPDPAKVCPARNRQGGIRPVRGVSDPNPLRLIPASLNPEVSRPEIKFLSEKHGRRTTRVRDLKEPTSDDEVQRPPEGQFAGWPPDPDSHAGPERDRMAPHFLPDRFYPPVLLQRIAEPQRKRNGYYRDRDALKDQLTNPPSAGPDRHPARLGQCRAWPVRYFTAAPSGAATAPGGLPQRAAGSTALAGITRSLTACTG